MPATIKHHYNQTVADGTATSVVRPSDWNSGHDVTLNIASSEVTDLQGPSTYNYFNPRDGYLQVTGQHGQGSLHFQPVQANNVNYDRWAIPLNFALTTSTCSLTLSMWAGIYTRNGSTLSLASSTSFSSAFTISTGNTSLFAGVRLLTIPDTDFLPDGQYFFAFVSRSTTGGANMTVNQIVVSQQNSNFSGLVGVAVNATQQYTRGLGYYTATTSGIPGSVAFSQINGTASMALRPPLFYLASLTF